MNLARLLLTPFIVRRGNFKRFKKIASSENGNNISDGVDEKNENIPEHVDKKIRYIPEEVIVHILNYSDARSILNFSLVSRHFKELVVQIERISVKIPYAIGIREHGVPVWPRGLKNFLRQFSGIRFAEVKFSCDTPNPYPESIIRWKYCPQGIISLYVRKCIPSSDDEGECSLFDESHVTRENFPPVSALMKDEKLHRLRWIRYMKGIVRILPNLEELTVVDSSRRGRMIIDGAFVDYLRGNSRSPIVKVKTKTWKSDHVMMPVSGYVLRGVTVTLVRLNEVSDEIVAQNFCEEPEYCQVVTSLMAEAPCSRSSIPVSKYTYM